MFKFAIFIFGLTTLLIASTNECDKILENGYFSTCYSYKYKSAVFSHSILKEELVNSVNIQKRPNFYSDKNLPENVRVKPSDYDKTGFDRGHLQNDANFDYSEESLNSTYVMSNMTLQYPKTNRVSNKLLEVYTRDKLKEMKVIDNLIVIKYTDKKVNNIGVPLQYEITLENKDKNYKECFILKNDNISYTVDELRVNCK